MIESTINFYHINEPYGEFSNFSRHPIVIDGKCYPTSEHYFQAMKFEDLDVQEQVRIAETPKMAATLGRDRSFSLRSDWEDVKDGIMYLAVHTKFTQYGFLKELLINTGNSILVEHTENDRYWGDGGDGSGRNMLGKILMKVRDNLNNQLVE
jgi:ribA/ribD-fused uncharacterized protein